MRIARAIRGQNKFAKALSLWHLSLTNMSALNSLRLGLCIALAGCSAALAQLPAGNGVAGSWHFAGASHLAADTNFAIAKSVFTQKSSAEFTDIVLTRFSGWVAGELGINTDKSALRPLVTDVLLSESYFAMGGKAPGPLNFILAIQLDDARAKVWQGNLQHALGSPGTNFAAGDFTGQRWDLPHGKSFWIIPARHWFLVGSGEELSAQRTADLKAISQNGSPVPPLDQSWFEADIDWPKLTNWLPAPPFELKPAHAQISMTTKAGTLRMKAKLTYPKPLQWKFKPWNVPTNLVNNPLVSFTASQDVAAVMTDDEPLAKLTDNPLTGELFLWAMGIQSMPFQSYAAWPVENPTNTLQRIGAEVPPAFTIPLEMRHGGAMIWHPDSSSLIWEKLATFFAPTLQATDPTNGSFLLASLFPMAGKPTPAPPGLFAQFANSNNVIFYDWELTSPRLQHWRLLSALLPIFPPAPLPVTAAGASGNPAAKPDIEPLVANEHWLAGLTNIDNTVTEASVTGPAEITVLRKSPFVFNSLELLLLSHWLTGTGSPGVNPSLMPPRAKTTGPGIPQNTP
jgi:hypothetical protein